MADWEALIKTPQAAVDGMRLNLAYAQGYRMGDCSVLTSVLQGLKPDERRAALENMKQQQADKEIADLPAATISTDVHGNLVFAFPGCPKAIDSSLVSE